MNTLYPLKFMPIFKEKIWGGTKIKDELGLDFGTIKKCGEAWMLSDIEGQESVVCNGFLEGNSLAELMEVYMGDLVGEKIYEYYQGKFPLLFKWLNAEDDLSVQVHPNDEMALKKHGSFGKNELWYIQQANPKSVLYSGFAHKPKRNEYIDKMGTRSLIEDLACYKPQPGDVYYIPAGTVHALGAGILLAEIQQSADVTYRMYDWDRKTTGKEKRDLHLGDAIDAIDFNPTQSSLISYSRIENNSNLVITSPHFTTNYISLQQAIEKDFTEIDSFVVYLCVDGNGVLKVDEQVLEIKKGELVLVPAIANKIGIFPDVEAIKLLETYLIK